MEKCDYYIYKTSRRSSMRIFKICLLVGTVSFFCGAYLIFHYAVRQRSISIEHRRILLPVHSTPSLEENEENKLQFSLNELARTMREEIECRINEEYNINCLKESGEIYVPFSFLHKYFEVYGKVENYDGSEWFAWSHSDGSKVYKPKQKYSTEGVFLFFENSNVEARDRVKCISGIEGVPVTTQWNRSGHFYPIQIAQFGLSHYSKNLTEPEPKRQIIAQSNTVGYSWTVPEGSSLISLVTNYSKPDRSSYLEFKALGEDGITLEDPFSSGFVLSLDLKLSNGHNSSMRVTLLDLEQVEMWFLNYVCGNFFIEAKNHSIYHGIKCNEWTSLTRDLFIDLQKGLRTLGLSKTEASRSKLKILNIKFFGSGSLSSVSLATSEHLKQLMTAADWFISNQNVTTGGWANFVRHTKPGFNVLEPGWYSAMGQGHAISLLSRAYHVTKDAKYLEAAQLALKPFHLSSRKGGVVAHFMDHLVWYEEYPTQPSSFTLNGFIYSLIGLYDLMSIAPENKKNESLFLFNEGIESLKKMLLLFDTGSGTMYDLRHLTLGTVPNLARWEYHAVHVSQLLHIHTFYDDDLFLNTAERWHFYMRNVRAPHN